MLWLTLVTLFKCVGAADLLKNNPSKSDVFQSFVPTIWQNDAVLVMKSKNNKSSDVKFANTEMIRSYLQLFTLNQELILYAFCSVLNFCLLILS